MVSQGTQYESLQAEGGDLPPCQSASLQQLQKIAAISSSTPQTGNHSELIERQDGASEMPLAVQPVTEQPGNQNLGLSGRSKSQQKSFSGTPQASQEAAELPSSSRPTLAGELPVLPSPERRLNQKPAKRKSLREASENSRDYSRKPGWEAFLQMLLLLSCASSLLRTKGTHKGLRLSFGILNAWSGPILSPDPLAHQLSK